MYSLSIKNIFYNKMDLRRFYFHVTKYAYATPALEKQGETQVLATIK